MPLIGVTHRTVITAIRMAIGTKPDKESKAKAVKTFSLQK